jgi:photosystem II stability/assembly factor-like uncharacterized protein
MDNKDVFTVKRTCFFVLLLAFYFTNSCDFGQDTVMFGRVTDNGTGQPIAGAVVSTVPPTDSAVTDADGYYFFESIEPGIYTISASVTGYKSASVTVTATEGREQRVDFSLKAVVVESGSPAYQGGTWLKTGGPFGRIGYDIRMRPDDPDIMYVTDDGAGAFKSTDGGHSWFSLNDGIIPSGFAGDSYSVFSLTIDPNNNDIIWIGSSSNSNIYRSTDAGTTWELKTKGVVYEHESFRGFTVEPGNSNVVYAASEVPSFDWNVEELEGIAFDIVKGSVYKTTDGGDNWTRIWFGENLCRYIWIDPDDHNRLFVSTGIFDREAANSDPEKLNAGGVGILRSTDGGMTWTELDEKNGFDEKELYAGTLYMHPEDSDVLFAGTENPYLEVFAGGLYMTEDGGDTWKEVIKDPINSVEICEGNPDIGYAISMDAVYLTTDGGKSWVMRSEEWGPAGIIPGIPIDIQCDPRDEDRLFLNGYGGGNFLSTDGGKTWVTATDGYTGARVADVAVSTIDSGLIFASGRPGFFTSTDAGGSWSGLGYNEARGLEKAGISIDSFDDLHLILCSDPSDTPLETFDGGKTWTRINLDPREFGDEISICKVVFSPRDANTLFALPVNDFWCWKGLEPQRCGWGEGGGLQISTNGGKTWSSTSISSGNVVSIAISSSDGGPMYVSVYNKGIYRSDDGQTWQQVYDGSSEVDTRYGYWAKLAIDPADSKRIYAGMANGGVFISTDSGVTWNDSSAGMPAETTVTHIVSDPNNQGLVYVCSMNAGVFYSTDSGSQWQSLNNGLDLKTVLRLALSSGGTVLYAATEGGGVYRLGSPPSN